MESPILKTPSVSHSSLWRAAHRETLSLGREILERFSETACSFEASVQTRCLPLLRELKKEPDETFLLHGLLQVGIRLKAEHCETAARSLLERLSQPDVPEETRRKAKREYFAMIGRESSGMHAEYLLSKFSGDGEGLRGIAPMIGATVLGQVVGTALLGKLGGAATRGFLTRGWGAKLTAGVGAFFAEVPTLAALNRAFSPSPRDSHGVSFGDELLQSALNLGAFRVFGGIGHAGASLAAPLQGILPTASIFLGLLASRHLEERFHLRPSIENATTATDVLGSMAFLLTGANLGNRLLGRPWATFRKEMQLRTEGPARHGGTKDNPESWQPTWASEPLSKIPIFKGLEKSRVLGAERPWRTEKLRPEGEPRPGEIVGIPGINAMSRPSLPSAPATATRTKPKFKRLELKGTPAANPGDLEPIGQEILCQVLLTSRSRLNAEDALDYTRFVLSRLPDYPSVLLPFAVPEGIADLQAALAFFCERYKDESEAGLKSIFRKTGILPEEASLDKPLSHEMLVLMRRVRNDAVYYLDRLEKLFRLDDPAFLPQIERLDPSRLRPQQKYSLADWQELQDPDTGFPELTAEVLRNSYRHMVWDRMLTQIIYKNIHKVAFVVTDAGHEVFGTAAAYAFHHGVNPKAFSICPHYRCSALLGTWAELQGYGHDRFIADYLRQQMSRQTDKWSKGRQTASHFNDQEYQVLPGQSEVGRNLLKAAGFARALQQAGHKDGVVYAEIGDGSIALDDFYEAMTGAALMGYEVQTLPLIVGIADNGMAISVEPTSGRAFVDLKSFAKSLGASFFTCDGNDYLDVYQTYRVAIWRSRKQQKPAIIWVQNLPRLNGHSNAAQYDFDFRQSDPVVPFGEELVAEGLEGKEQIMIRHGDIKRNFFLDNHDWGEIGRTAEERIMEIWHQVEAEPEPTVAQMMEDVRIEFPRIQEPPGTNRPTVIKLKGAIRAALRHILEEHALTWVNGQDTGMSGGVFKATAGLWDLFPDKVTDAPINEPLIIASAFGFALHEGAVAFPEIQFGDYSLSAYHWFYNAGGLLWTSGGSRKINLNIRLPVEPLRKGAVYHSTPLEGLLAAIPGLTIVSVSNTRDAYGVPRSSAEYPGPVVIFEPKVLYDSAVGDAFENEPLDEFSKTKLNREVSHGGIPDIPRDFRVPLGKAAVRREGKDLTILTWGYAHYKTVNRGNDNEQPSVLDRLVQNGVDVELIDLRTLVPPDMETVLASVQKTGRILVAHEDRVFSSLGSEIVRQVREKFADRIIASEILGMAPVPGVPQNRAMDAALTVSSEKIFEAAMRVMGRES